MALALTACAVAVTAPNARANGHDQSAAQEQAALITPAFKAVSKAYDPKHTPKITAPAKVKAGQWFDVTIEIGQGLRHPSLVEHHVRWIALLKNDVELARAYLHPVQTSPKVTFTIALEETAELRVLEEPTHSAPWESSQRVEVE